MSAEAKLGFWCTCGGAMTGRVAPASELPRLEALFRQVHVGPDHEPTSREVAAKARRRLEQTDR